MRETTELVGSMQTPPRTPCWHSRRDTAWPRVTSLTLLVLTLERKVSLPTELGLRVILFVWPRRKDSQENDTGLLFKEGTTGDGDP